MTRQQRHVDELRALCTSGHVARAVDLAFEHFATFGRDEHVIELLAEAVDHGAVGEAIRRRLDELSTSVHADPGTRSAPCRAR